MPISQYFGGKGGKVLTDMMDRYGPKKGKSVFYATVNRERKGSAAERANQPAAAPGSKRRP